MNLKFTSLEKDDLTQIKNWRNEQQNICRYWKPLTDDNQEDWYYTYSDKDAREVIFAIREIVTLKHGTPSYSETTKEYLIGYCGLVYIDWLNRRAEYSILVDKARHDNYDEIFKKTTDFIVGYGFSVLNLNKITTETFAFRKHQIELLDKYGFERQGILIEHTYKKGKYWDSHLHAIFKF
jgi:RimJ/RimL family protein N-acetyltransferase